MSKQYRLTTNDLLQVLEVWDTNLKKKVFLVACGGTALSLMGHKESTKDVDFLIQDHRHFREIVRMVSALGYVRATGFGYRHNENPWIFDLFPDTIFGTALLDPVQERGKHRIIKHYKHITLACLNPDDLIISKMFRGTLVDVQDSIVLIKAENIDLASLAQRYRDTADYDVNPPKCKQNIQYLIQELELENIDASPLKDMSAKWNP